MVSGPQPSNRWITPPPPEPQPRRGFKCCSESRRATELMAPPRRLLSHCTEFFTQPLSFYHIYPHFISPALSVCSLPDPTLFILHMSPPCASFCFITHQIRLQYLPPGSDLQVGKRQIDLVNKPDKFSPLNRADLSVRRSLLFICGFENMTPAARAEQEPQVIRLNDSADRSG